MTKRKAATTPAFEPYVVRDPYVLVRSEWLGKWLVVGRTFCGYRAIGRTVHMDGVTPGVTHRVIADGHKRHYPELENIACASFLAGLKEEMLAHGATELAVQWALELEPTVFTEKELQTMADKLQAKGKTAPKKDTKAPAAKGGGKGNPEALAKAREAQASKKAEQLADKRKIALTDKGSEKVKKGGESGAVQNLIAMKNAKTVGKAIEGGLTMADINYAEKSGTITVG